MNKQITLGELVKWILANRKGNAFKDVHEYTIASSVLRASEEGTMLYACNDNGTLVGVVVASADNPRHVMHIHDILTTERWVIKSFLRYFIEGWPEWKLQGYRDGELVEYNTPNLINKLMKGKE